MCGCCEELPASGNGSIPEPVANRTITAGFG